MGYHKPACFGKGTGNHNTLDVTAGKVATYIVRTGGLDAVCPDQFLGGFMHPGPIDEAAGGIGLLPVEAKDQVMGYRCLWQKAILQAVFRDV